MTKKTEKQYRDRNFINKTKEMADRVISISSIPELGKHLCNIGLIIASAMIREYGWYGYTEAETGNKVFIELV